MLRERDPETGEGILQGWVAIHVDDLLCTGAPRLLEQVQASEKMYPVIDSNQVSSVPQGVKYCGARIR